MAYDYSKLLGKITEVYSSQGAFAIDMHLSERSISLKLNNKRGWKQNEIVKACSLLNIDDKEIPDYFFCLKSSKTLNHDDSLQSQGA